MNALAKAHADIDAATDPYSELNIIRARTFRRQRRTERRVFIIEALKRRNCCWYVLSWLSGGMGIMFLSFDESVDAIRRHIRNDRACARKGRVYRYSAADMKYRLVVARYFARHARDLLAVDVREVA